jgi:putative aldouronate transport system substrate-binding protein
VSLQRLEAMTNVKLEFVAIPDSPGDVALGEMLRSGETPDLMPEARLQPSDIQAADRFVNVLEFPSLTQNFAVLARTDEEFLRGTLSRVTASGRLYSLGTYAEGQIPFHGVLAYRQDLFSRHELPTDTWDEIMDALLVLKEEYPNSFPFGGTFRHIVYTLPCWFGSGLDPDHIVYFDTKAMEWRFGPFEPQFRDYLFFVAALYEQELVNPDIIVQRRDRTLEGFANNVVFMAPYAGPTGRRFPLSGPTYGGVTEEGTWNGEGAWVAPLPLPPAPNDTHRWYSTKRYDPVGPGWMVHSQSDFVGEALAFTDFLLRPDAARVVALGPEGVAWQETDGSVTLQPAFAEAYASGGIEGLHDALAANDTPVGLPIRGLRFDYYQELGFPDVPALRYFLSRGAARNKPGRDIMVEPGVSIPLEDRRFARARADAILGLQTMLESNIANFMLGRRSLSDYDAFVDELHKAGAQELLDLYRERCRVLTADAVLPE